MYTYAIHYFRVGLDQYTIIVRVTRFPHITDGCCRRRPHLLFAHDSIVIILRCTRVGD